MYVSVATLTQEILKSRARGGETTHMQFLFFVRYVVWSLAVYSGVCVRRAQLQLCTENALFQAQYFMGDILAYVHNFDTTMCLRTTDVLDFFLARVE